MVVDTSAIVAILLGEPDADRFARAIAAAPVRLLSAVNRVELSLVIEGRKGDAGRRALDAFLAEAAIVVADIGAEQATLAIEAFRRFGRSRHPAGLNIGDCFAYALARATDEPLLFKGQDFARTDVRAALGQGPENAI
jgi:ribonuclease VapC